MCLLSLSLLGFTVWCIFYVKKDDERIKRAQSMPFPEYMVPQNLNPQVVLTR